MFKIKHCVDFDALDIWYLENIKGFENRFIALGICPKCNKKIAVLSETDCGTKKVYESIYADEKAFKVVKNELKRVTYTVRELDNIDKTTVGLRYGVNTERKNKKNTTIKQYACDFYGNKHLSRVYKINQSL